MGQLLCIEGISYCETIEARVAQAKLDQPSTPICSVCMNWCEANSQCQTCGFLAVLAVPPPSLLPHVQQIDPFVKQILDNYVKMVPNPCANLAYEIKDLSKRLLQSPPSTAEEREELSAQLYALTWIYAFSVNDCRDYDTKCALIADADALYTTARSAITTFVLQSYKHLHPELLEFNEKWLSEALQVAATCGDRESILKCLRKECPTAFSVPLLSPDYCRLLIDEMRNVKKFVPLARLDHMGLNLECLGFGPFMRQLSETITRLARPFCSSLMELSMTQPFVIHYSVIRGGFLAQPIHADQSDLTMNLCLGDYFEGGDLRLYLPKKLRQGSAHSPSDEAFWHRSGPSSASIKRSKSTHVHTYSHEVGRAFFHPGEIVHDSASLTQGERWNLIVWWQASSRFEKFQELPKELQEYILGYVSPSDLASLCCCSKSMIPLAESDMVWKSQFEQVFSTGADTGKGSWKQTYKASLSAIKLKEKNYEDAASQPRLIMKVAYGTPQPKVNLPDTAQFIPILLRQVERKRSGRCFIQ